MESDVSAVADPATGVAVHVDHDDLVQFETFEEATLVEFASVARQVRYFDSEGPELIAAIAAPPQGADVPPWSSLLLGPLLRGTEITAR